MFFDACLWNTVSAIRVGYLARHSAVVVPVTKFSVSVLRALEESGAIGGFVLFGDLCGKNQARISLSYVGGNPAISKLTVLSKKSRRVYIKSSQLMKVYSMSRGCAILSTSCGVITGGEACQKKLGGEFLIWVQY